MLFGIEEAQGYDPAQLKRYWTFLRATQRAVILYNEAYFLAAKPLALNLFQVAYVVQPSADPKAVPASQAVATEGGFTLYRLASPSAKRSATSTARRLRSSVSRRQTRRTQAQANSLSLRVPARPPTPRSIACGSAQVSQSDSVISRPPTP